MRRSVIISALLPLLALISCAGGKGTSEPYLPLVKQALTDTSSVAWQMLDGCRPGNPGGSIALIGDCGPLYSLVSEFLRSDRFDNIDGREAHDELHDFAGETFTPVFDVANSPYDGYMEAGNIPALREAAVGMAISSLSRTCYSNTFDEKPAAERIPAKVLVLCSPYLCRYALGDIDTLTVSKGIDVPVLSAVDEMFRMAGKRHPEGLIAVLADGKELDYGLYRSIYERVRGQEGTFPDYIEHADSCGDSRTAFLSFLDSFIASGDHRNLSAVLVGSASDSLDVGSLGAVLDEIRTSPGPVMENYRSVLADDFEFISGEDAVIRACYRVLRRGNLFTHRIAYPAVRAYVTVPSSEVPLEDVDFGGSIEPRYKYNHSADAKVQVTRTVPVSRLYMSGERLARINSLSAPIILNMNRLTD